MTPTTMTEPATYEHVLDLFHALSEEERQQFVQHIAPEQVIPSRPVGSNGNGAGQQRVVREPLPFSEHITSNPLYTHGDSLMQNLTQAAAKEDTRTFVDLIRDLDWSQRTAEEIDYTIDLSFTMMMSRISLDLVKKAAEIFPDNAEFQRQKRLFFPENPARTPQKKRGRIKGLQESEDWLRDHVHEYRGKWLAVNQGKLIAVASTYKELKEKIADAEDPDSTLIQQV